MRWLNGFKKTSYPGFTFIEMLVVITLMALMTTVIAVKLNTASKASRDKKRLVDLKTIQAALVLYNSDWQAYPATITFSGSLTTADGSRTYLQEIPQDPSSPTRTYYYSSDTSQYVLCTAMEKSQNIPSAGSVYYPPAGLPADSCGSGIDCNYCLQGY